MVFLLAGPATNAATVVLLDRVLGRRAVVVYLVTIAVCAVAAGYAVDGLYAVTGIDPQALPQAGQTGGHHWTHVAAAVALALLTANGLRRRYAPTLFGRG